MGLNHRELSWEVDKATPFLAPTTKETATRPMRKRSANRPIPSPQKGVCEEEDELQTRAYAAQLEQATWRMYERIMSHRQWQQQRNQQQRQFPFCKWNDYYNFCHPTNESLGFWQSSECDGSCLSDYRESRCEVFELEL